MGRAIDIAELADMIAARTAGHVRVVGVTGSVAAGKSTLCDALAAAMAPRRIEIVSTDGFLLPNAELEARGLMLRKGFPETYDGAALQDTLTRVREGAVTIPVYSHTTYDIDPAGARRVDRPDVLLVEGLGLSPPPAALDVLLYLDADEADLETWFVARFMDFRRAAEADPSSFYARFVGLSPEEADAFARSVWARINLPNLRDHIVHARDAADIVVRKDGAHRLWMERGR